MGQALCWPLGRTVVSDLVMPALKGEKRGVGPGARLTVFAPSHNMSGS